MWFFFQTALEVAKRGGEVHLVCRNPASAEEAKNELVEATSNNNIFVHILDMSNIKAIHQVVINKTLLKSEVIFLLLKVVASEACNYVHKSNDNRIYDIELFNLESKNLQI